MADNLGARTPRENDEYGIRFPKLAFHEWIGLPLWLGMTAFFAQFALASADELEPQASILGWFLVIILLVGGLTFWIAKLHSNHRQQD